MNFYKISGNDRYVSFFYGLSFYFNKFWTTIEKKRVNLNPVKIKVYP